MPCNCRTKPGSNVAKAAVAMDAEANGVGVAKVSAAATKAGASSRTHRHRHEKKDHNLPALRAPGRKTVAVMMTIMAGTAVAMAETKAATNRGSTNSVTATMTVSATGIAAANAALSDNRGDDRNNRSGYSWGRDNDNRGNRWNQGWRNDRRYDWRGHRDRYRNYYSPGRYYSPYRGHSYRRYGIGINIGSAFFGSRYWINDPSYYRLPPAYGPYRWVRYYDDVLLVDLRSGRVVDAIHDFFW